MQRHILWILSHFTSFYFRVSQHLTVRHPSWPHGSAASITKKKTSGKVNYSDAALDIALHYTEQHSPVTPNEIIVIRDGVIKVITSEVDLRHFGRWRRLIYSKIVYYWLMYSNIQFLWLLYMLTLYVNVVIMYLLMIEYSTKYLFSLL